MAKRWENTELYIFAPAIAKATIERELPSAKFVAMPSGDSLIRNPQLRNLYRTLAGVRRLREFLACDALVATSHFLPDIAPALMFSSGRTIVTVHHILTAPSAVRKTLADSISAAFQWLAFFWIRTSAAAVFVYSRDVADRIGIDSRRTGVFLISNGANSPVEPDGLGRGRRGAVFLGRLVPVKGLDDLLRAWALLMKNGVASELTIAGTGAPNYVAHLEGLARELDIANSVRFLGQVSEREKSAILSTARVFAFASKEEGWGIVLAEAMTHGLPCLTYDLPAYRDVFVRGRISVPVGDVGAFAASLERLLTDDGFARAISSEALDLASTFTWERAAKLEYEALETIMQ